MTATFTADQIKTLRDEYAKIDRVHPDRLSDFRALFAKCDDITLIDLAKAKIKFVSLLAVSACVRRGLSLA